MIECAACRAPTHGGTDWCYKHLSDVLSNKLVDDLAREIYVKEWLIPQKKKKELPSSVGVGYLNESIYYKEVTCDRCSKPFMTEYPKSGEGYIYIRCPECRKKKLK